MTRDELDVTRFVYDPFAEDLVEQLSVFGEFSTSWGDADKYKTELARYIVICYDFNSPMRFRYGDLWDRKRESAVLAGVPVHSSGSFMRPAEDAIIGKNDAVTLAVTKYLMLFGKPALVMLEAALAQFHSETTLMLKGGGDKDTVKVAREMKGYIEELTKELYGGDEIIEVRKRLYQKMEQRRVQVRPEDFVERIAKGDDLLDGSPYGADYKVDGMKFLSDEVPE